MIKRLIFDVDGTLITGVSFTESIKKTLNRLDIHSENSVELFLQGINTYEQLHDNYNIKDYTNHMQQAIKSKLPVDFLYTFWDELKNAIPAKNDILINAISKLSKEYELVLLTNYFAQSQLNRLNNMGIGKFFSECYGEHCIKPNKKAYLDACGDKKTTECIMIGDDLHLDIERAKQEGLSTIFVNSKNIEVDDRIGITVSSVTEISKKLISKIEERNKKLYYYT